MLTVPKLGVSLSAAAASGLPGQVVTSERHAEAQHGQCPPGRGDGSASRVDGGSVGTATTNASGVVTLPYTVAAGATAGVHAITATFAGDGSDSAGTGKGTLTVKAATSLSVSPSSGARGTTATLTATLTSGGAGLAGRSVTFLVDGKSAGTAMTVAGGAASRAYAIPAAAGAGAHAVTATFCR